MRIHISVFTLAIAAVAGCNDPTQSSTASELLAPAHATANAATTDRGEGVYTVVDERHFLDCVGEEVVFNHSVPYRWHSTTTPTGQTTFVWPLIPNSQPGTAVGQSTGRVWTSEQVISPEADHFSGDPTGITFTAYSRWVRDGGPTMLIHTRFHFSQNAAGETKVERFEARCDAH